MDPTNKNQEKAASKIYVSRDSHPFCLFPGNGNQWVYVLLLKNAKECEIFSPDNYLEFLRNRFDPSFWPIT
jgi:hypothetical protein